VTLGITYLKVVAVPLMRSPGYWVPVVLFPSLLFAFFGAGPSEDDPRIAGFLLASWSAFAVLGIGFFQFGVSIAQSREEKWTDFVRTLPAGAMPKITAQLGTAALFLVLALGLLWILAFFLTSQSLATQQYLQLGFSLLVGMVPFLFLGVTLGFALPARVAVPIANLFYLPLSYLGGLWIPPDQLPKIIQDLGPFVPTRHLGELAWAAVLGVPPPLASIGALGVFTVLFLATAVFFWRRDEVSRSN